MAQSETNLLGRPFYHRREFASEIDDMLRDHWNGKSVIEMLEITREDAIERLVEDAEMPPLWADASAFHTTSFELYSIKNHPDSFKNSPFRREVGGAVRLLRQAGLREEADELEQLEPALKAAAVKSKEAFFEAWKATAPSFFDAEGQRFNEIWDAVEAYCEEQSDTLSSYEKERARWSSAILAIPEEDYWRRVDAAPGQPKRWDNVSSWPLLKMAGERLLMMDLIVIGFAGSEETVWIEQIETTGGIRFIVRYRDHMELRAEDGETILAEAPGEFWEDLWSKDAAPDWELDKATGKIEYDKPPEAVPAKPSRAETNTKKQPQPEAVKRERSFFTKLRDFLFPRPPKMKV